MRGNIMQTRNAAMFSTACQAKSVGRTSWMQHVWVAFLAIGALLMSAQVSAATLENIEFSSLPGDRTEIRLSFDGVPPEPRGYTIDSPARIALDLPEVRNALSDRYHTLGSGNAREVTVVEAQDRTRVIVNLTRLVPYEAWVEGNDLYVLVGADDGSERVPAEVAEAQVERQPSDEPRAPVSRASRVTDVDFRRTAEGEGRVVIRLSDPRAPVDVSSEAGRIRVEIQDTELPSELRRRLDVTDFATPVQLVDAVQEGSHTRFTIRATGNYDYLSYQADNVLTINVQPLTEDDLARRDDEFRYTGDKLSLNFQDIPVRSVLQLIADFTDLNLVASDTVGGRITLRLQNVPWDQALDLILRTKGLDKRQVGNVLLVAPAQEIAARERLELENQRQISELAPLRTEFIQVRYANAQQLFSLFEGQGPGVLSERGTEIIDERTNSIILTDTAERLESFRQVIAQLDIPVRQVLIEARIVTANANYSRDLGIRWGIGGSARTPSNTTLNFGSGLGGTGRMNVDLGVGSPTGAFGIGFIADDYVLDVALGAMAAEGNAEVISRPKVITSDKQMARIESGSEIPYEEAAASGATSISFKRAVLGLEVTPQITPDDRIIMQLRVNQDSVAGTVPTREGGEIPFLETNIIDTQVLVDNGQTIVLGGVFQGERSYSVSKVPVLGDLPMVGAAFRRTSESETKSELLIFITPKIIKDTLTNR